MRSIARRKVVYCYDTDRSAQRFAITAPGFVKWQADGSLIFACTAANLDVWDAVVNQPITDEDGSLSGARMPKLSPLADMPLLVKASMFEHQRWMVSTALQRKVFGTFFDMGTGKSAIALWIACELFLRGKIKQMLFVTVSNNIKQFLQEQIPMHMPDDPSYLAVQIPSTQFNKLGKLSGQMLNIGVCGHGAFQGTKSIEAVYSFVKRGPTLLVIDESTGFKGWKGKRFDNMIELRKSVEHVYLMTGDPSPHGLEDLFSQFYILDPRIIGHASLTSFRNQYCIMVPGFQGYQMVGGYKNKDELYRKISPYCRFVRIEDCHDMPQQIFLEKTFKMDDAQAKAFKGILEDWETLLDSGDTKVVESAREKFIALQTISNGWIKGDDGLIQTISSTRARMVVDECLSVNGKVVVWCAYHGDIDMMSKILASEGIPFVKFYGALSKEQNSENREKFNNDPDCKVFLATAASGGSALNLQVASHMVYFSNSFNYGDRSQSERRTWRLGQEQHCVYIDIIGSPIDRHILRNLRDKRDLSSEVRSLAGLRRIAAELRGDMKHAAE